ncbi:MAG TPA: hypothetical protein VHX36_09215 [Candidatus Acidoferrales bacterium]|jgi:hypothetical protein|nr:hypothetical protein [Candidatus Acidoferrales bacterium]
MRGKRRGVDETPAGIRNQMFRQLPRRSRARCSALILLLASAALLPLSVPQARAQDNPKLVIDEDCQAFDISAHNEIVFAVPKLKRVKKLIIERDEIDVATGPGRGKRLVDVDKFMPVVPPSGYVVNTLLWAPDAKHIAASITMQEPPPDYHPHVKKKGEEDRSDDSDVFSVGGRKAVALFDDDGNEIKVAGSKDRFIQDATNATWLDDGQTVVYLSLAPPYTITRVRPSDGQTTPLFEGHTFDTVIWDAARNRAFAVSSNLSLRGRLTILALDLLHESVTELATIDNYNGSLAVSKSGKKIGFFEDGDTIEVIDIDNPSKRIKANAGIGRFEWGNDDDRVLLKRGSPEESNDLVWVGLNDDSFTPVLHDLEFHDFHIAPDGRSLAVTVPGKRVLKVFPLE